MTTRFQRAARAAERDEIAGYAKAFRATANPNPNPFGRSAIAGGLAAEKKFSRARKRISTATSVEEAARREVEAKILRKKQYKRGLL